MKSAWHLHIEVDKRIRQLKKRREWWALHGVIVRGCIYLGLGLVIAIILYFVFRVA